MTRRPFEIIPAVDVLDGKVVRLLHGDFAQVTVYSDDPVGEARRWLDEGAGIVHVVDLEGARRGESDESLWRAMAEAGVTFQVGGGIRTAGVARRALRAGAERVVMGTAAVWSPEILAEVGDPERVIAAVDVRGDRATGAGWLDGGRLIGDVLDGLARVGVERVLVTGIGADGTMSGPETSLISRVVADDRFSVLASGGVGGVDDLVALARSGCEGAIVGRALYEGRVDLAAALAAAATA